MLSLHSLQRKQKNYSKPFRIRTFLFLSLLIWNCNDQYVHTLRRFLETMPDSRPKWAKCIPVFRPKRRKNPTRWGGTYLYGYMAYIREYPPGFLRGVLCMFCSCTAALFLQTL